MPLTRLNYDNIRSPIFVNDKLISQNVYVSNTENAGSFGPIEIAEGYIVELEANSVWTIV